jgi:hypothetical protein
MSELFNVFRTDPPAPVSNKPPPCINGTMDNILAEVPSSRIGINPLDNHANVSSDRDGI